MSEISETEIKSMSKEQNYMRGYKDGKSDVLDKIISEIKDDWQLKISPRSPFSYGLGQAIEIIEKYKSKSEDKE